MYLFACTRVRHVRYANEYACPGYFICSFVGSSVCSSMPVSNPVLPSLSNNARADTYTPAWPARRHAAPHTTLELWFFAAPPSCAFRVRRPTHPSDDDSSVSTSSSIDVHIDVLVWELGSFAEISGLPETPTRPLVATEQDVARVRQYTAPVLFKKRRAILQEMGAKTHTKTIAKTHPTDRSLCTGLSRIIPASWRSSAAVDRAVVSRDLLNGAVENRETFRSFFPPKFGCSFALLIFFDKCFDLRIVLL